MFTSGRQRVWDEPECRTLANFIAPVTAHWPVLGHSLGNCVWQLCLATVFVTACLLLSLVMQAASSTLLPIQSIAYHAGICPLWAATCAVKHDWVWCLAQCWSQLSIAQPSCSCACRTPPLMLSFVYSRLAQVVIQASQRHFCTTWPLYNTTE